MLELNRNMLKTFIIYVDDRINIYIMVAKNKKIWFHISS